MMNQGLVDLLKRISFRTYIDEIQSEIGRIIREVGVGVTEEEREKGRNRLQAKVKELSKRLASELRLRGDPNIDFMLTSGMISTAWATFILKAKSLDPLRPKRDRIAMVAIADGMVDSFEEIIRQSISYGEIYDKIKKRQLLVVILDLKNCRERPKARLLEQFTSLVVVLRKGPLKL